MRSLFGIFTILAVMLPCIFADGITQEWTKQMGDADYNKIMTVDFDEHNSALYSVTFDMSATTGQYTQTRLDRHGADGTLVWSYTPEAGDFISADLAVGKNHVYHTTFDSTSEVILHKRTNDGANVVWSASVGVVDGPEQYPVLLANYWPTHHMFASTTSASNEMALQKLNKRDGTLEWAKTYTGTRGDGSPCLSAVFANAVDPHHQLVYLAGFVQYGNLGDDLALGADDGALIAVNADTGDVVWQHLFGTAGADVAVGVAVDSNGYVYVTGYTTGGDMNGEVGRGLYDSFVLKYDFHGVLQWSHLIGGAGLDVATSIEVNPKTNQVIILGTVNGANSGYEGQVSAHIDGDDGDTFMTTFKTDGTYVGTVFLHVMTQYLAADRQSGDLYLGGYSKISYAGQTAFGNDDAILIKNPAVAERRRALRG